MLEDTERNAVLGLICDRVPTLVYELQDRCTLSTCTNIVFPDEFWCAHRDFALADVNSDLFIDPGIVVRLYVARLHVDPELRDLLVELRRSNLQSNRDEEVDGHLGCHSALQRRRQ